MKATPVFDVVGLGQCSLDILGQLDSYPERDQKAELQSLLVQGGGPVATALVTLARLGVSTAFAGAVGDDDFGRQIRAGLLSEHVDCTWLRDVSGAASQVAFIAVDAAGHRNIFWHRGDVQPALPGTFAETLAAGVRVLHLDGLHGEVAIRAAEIARGLGVTTVLDAGTLRLGMDRLLPLIDHLVVSENFAQQLLGRDDPEAALRQLAAEGAQAVTITRGRHGSISLDQDQQIVHQPAFDVTVVDTTGCGDVFHGGYIYGLLQQWPLPQRVRFAAACAALKARRMGGRTAIPTRADVEALLASGQQRR